ncbi:MAG: hypothetical protein ABIH70_01590 [Chloroflexota bacterium]
MTLSKAHKTIILEYLVLLLIMGLAFYLAFIPHRSYPYPVHVDEWVHLAYSKAILQTGDITFPNPFFGDSIVTPGADLEVGFHLFFAVFQQLTGLSWMTIFRYFPGIIFVFTILSVYIFAKREGFGLPAAFFTCLIPTTVGILGPAFLVPVAMGLLFTPLLLFLAFNFRTIRSYLAIFLLIAFLLAIHAPSALSPIIILTPYILLNIKGNFKHSLGLLLTFGLPFLLIFPWITGLLLPTARSLLQPQLPNEFVQLPTIIRTYGYIPTGFCLLGAFVLAIKGGQKNYGLSLGLLAILLMLVVFFVFHYGVAIMYERGLMYAMLMISIVAGAGLASLGRLKLPAKLTLSPKIPTAGQIVGIFLCLVAVGVILATAIPDRQHTPYYSLIDKEDYQAFVWIRDNIDTEYSKAILDPWKATAFTAITSRTVYSRIHTAPTQRDEIAYDFLRNGSDNTTFLRENGISLVYTRFVDKGVLRTVDSTNPDLMKVADNIYVTKE